MTPTLFGRIQTRLFALLVVGGLWTLAITPFLPTDTPLGARYRATLLIVAVVAVAGVGWEVLYHLLQQFRWEKDWPALFGLLTAVNEGVVVWLLLDLLPDTRGVTAAPFLVHFTTTWLVTFLYVNGPMRVPFIRWRFRGGRLV